MGIQAAEISAILKDQIKNFGKEAEVAEVGRVLSVGDGIARVTVWTTFRPVKWSNSPVVSGHGAEPRSRQRRCCYLRF